MIAVIVPAHNEADHIANCVRTIKLASVHEGLEREPVLIIVVADACDDGTGIVAVRLGADVVAVAAGNVGATRRDGAVYALERGARWLAFTGADTNVSCDWLVQQLACNSDAVCGVVVVDDWSDHSEAVQVAYALWSRLPVKAVRRPEGQRCYRICSKRRRAIHRSLWSGSSALCRYCLSVLLVRAPDQHQIVEQKPQWHRVLCP